MFAMYSSSALNRTGETRRTIRTPLVESSQGVSLDQEGKLNPQVGQDQVVINGRDETGDWGWHPAKSLEELTQVLDSDDAGKRVGIWNDRRQGWAKQKGPDGKIQQNEVESMSDRWGTPKRLSRDSQGPRIFSVEHFGHITDASVEPGALDGTATLRENETITQSTGWVGVSPWRGAQVLDVRQQSFNFVD